MLYSVFAGVSLLGAIILALLRLPHEDKKAEAVVVDLEDPSSKQVNEDEASYIDIMSTNLC